VAKFLLLMEGLSARPSAPDEQTAAYNRKWAEWAGSLASSGVLESGLPLTATATEVTKDSVADLPLAATDIYGYLLINAASLDEAVDIARQAPHIELGGRTIVRPCAEPPGA
jgi:hypothetical protein